jgi:hypothetical protein
VEQRQVGLRARLLITRNLLRAAVSAALFLFVAGCGGTPHTVASGGRSGASCTSDRFPFRAPAAALTAADSGRTVTVATGALVEVSLLGRDAPGGRWPEPALQGDAVVALPNPAESATVGTQLAELCAVQPGEAVLTSGGWRVQIEVSGPAG